MPVCSPVSNAFQYQAGPRSSYRDSSQILNAGVLFHCGGSGSRGVCGLKGWVRSTTRNRPAVKFLEQFSQDARHLRTSQALPDTLRSLDRIAPRSHSSA